MNRSTSRSPSPKRRVLEDESDASDMNSESDSLPALVSDSESSDSYESDVESASQAFPGDGGGEASEADTTSDSEESDESDSGTNAGSESDSLSMTLSDASEMSPALRHAPVRDRIYFADSTVRSLQIAKGMGFVWYQFHLISSYYLTPSVQDEKGSSAVPPGRIRVCLKFFKHLYGLSSHKHFNLVDGSRSNMSLPPGSRLPRIRISVKESGILTWFKQFSKYYQV